MRRITILAVLILSMATFAEAQVATRAYIVPKIGDGLTPLTAFRPKYLGDMDVRYQVQDYGLEDTMLVVAQVTPAQHTTIAANTDAVSIPLPYDDPIGVVALSVVQARLEGMKIPADWLTASVPWRQVVRITRKLFELNARFHVLFGKSIWEAGITLDTRYNQLTQAQRNALQALAADKGIDTSSLTGASTLRQILRAFAAQLPDSEVMGESF